MGMVNYTEQDLLRAIGKVESIHSCAQVLARAFEILNDPDANQLDLVDTIRTDVGLTSDILRISNSAFYGGRMLIESLDDAIQRLGFREVMKLISISMSRQMFSHHLDHYGISSTDYWLESAAVATTMEHFSDLLDEDRSYYFTLGLLHCIGRLVINQTLSDRGSRLVWDRSIPANEWEVQNFGFDYTDSGHVLLTAWNFPQKMLAIILNQLTPDQVIQPTHSVRCLNYCIRWCASHKQFREPLAAAPKLESWMEKLEVTEDDLQDLYGKAEKSLTDMRHMVGI
jgi:HD-like signal output (HDOD) protein